MNQRLSTLLIVIVFCFNIPKIYSISQYQFDQYTSQNGLSNNSVKAIYQDQRGCIWIGTKDGLNWFDGLNFKTFRVDLKKQSSASANDITCISGNSKNLWIGTFNGVYVFDLNSYKFLNLKDSYINQPLPESVVTDIYFEGDYKVWVSTKKGLYVFNQKTFECTLLYKGMIINAIGEAAKGELLIGIAGKGVALLELNTLKQIYLTNNKNSNIIVQDIFKDSQNRIWMGTRSGIIYHFNSQQKKIEPAQWKSNNKSLIQNEEIHSIAQINDSSLFVGTNGGIYVINPTSFKLKEHLRANSSLGSVSHDRIMSIYKDRQGGVWVGTFAHGVNYYNQYRNPYQFYPLGNYQSILGEIVENNGKLWFGNERGIYSFDLKKKEISQNDLNSKYTVADIGKESKVIMNEKTSKIWIHLLDKGLYIFDTKSRSQIQAVPIDPTALVRCAAQDKQGNYWIGEEQLTIYNPQQKTFNANLYTNKESKTKFTLTQCTLMDSKGNMWVGTRSDGVFCYKWESVGYDLNRPQVIKRLIGKNISDLFEDSKGRIWFGTNGSGLYCYNPSNTIISVFEKKEGLQNLNICGIEEDIHTGDIWISTTTGISCVKKGVVSNYSNQSGLPLSEVSHSAFIKASDGNFYIGGREGLVAFKPENFKLNTYKPTVIINSIRSLNEEAIEFSSPDALKNVVLTYAQSSFVVSFAASNYLYPKSNKFAYKLKGNHKDWISLNNRNELTFSDLTEGTYQLCIKACNNDGVWNEDYTELEITVLPPLWRSWWAKLFYIVILISIVYLIINYFYIRNTYTYQLKLDQIEKENIEKQHRIKLQLFTNFSHELRTPLTLIIDPIADMLKDKAMSEKQKYALNLVYKNANRLLLLVNQLLDFRKIENEAMKLKVCNIDLVEFITDLLDTFKQYAEKRKIIIEYSIGYYGNDVWFDPILMEKVFFNILSNAFKNSKAGDSIKLSVEKFGELIRFCIKDAGQGIDSQDLALIFEPFFQSDQGNSASIFGSGIGLNLSKAIVEIHKGKIWAESKHGEGASFFVEIPLGKSHYTESSFTNTHVNHWINKRTEKDSLSEVETLKTELNTNSKQTILVVEDDSDIRHYITHLLSANYRVLEAENGSVGYNLAIQEIPDLIISDVMMPVVSGTELCQKIKQDICTAHIPVLLLTAKILTDHIKEGFELGADEYMLKPFDSELLITRVANLISGREKLRKLFKANFSLPEVNVIEVSANDKFLKKLFAFVETNIENSDLQIEDFCAEIGVSRVQLFRKLKALTGTTPNKLLLQFRLKTALKYLQSSDYSINEIAYKVGFDDPAYFGKCFKAEFHMTPKTYAQQFK